jgi:hypothetical protein
VQLAHGGYDTIPPFNEDAIIAAMEREPWRMSCDIGREFGVPQ